MTKVQALQKIATLLEKEKKFVVLPVDEYEDLLMYSDPEFIFAMKESSADIKAGRVKTLDQVIKDLDLDAKSSSHKSSRKRSKKAK